MPRPKKPGAPEPKRRSRNGCWPCKTRKIKCGEQKPNCENCERQGEVCDYSIRLNWEGRHKKKPNEFVQVSMNKKETPRESPQAGNVMRWHSEPTSSQSIVESYSTKPESQITNRVTETEHESQQHLVGDAYSLEGDSQGQNLSSGQFPVYTGSSPPTRKTTTNPRNSRDGSSDIFQKDPSSMGPQGLGLRDDISAAQLLRIRGQSGVSHHDPIDSLGNTLHTGLPGHSLSNPEMPPPPSQHYFSSSHAGFIHQSQDEVLPGERKSKRQRLNPSREDLNELSSQQPTSHGKYSKADYSKTITPTTHLAFASRSSLNGSGVATPTPRPSSMASNDSSFLPTTKPLSYFRQESPDRRLSVSSLLSGPPGGENGMAGSGGENTPASTYDDSSVVRETTNYGLDRGIPDLDIPDNDDAIALSGLSPPKDSSSHSLSEVDDTVDGISFPPEFGFGLSALDSAQGERGYYAQPVQVEIPKSLGMLPATLQGNSMNLLYFHHFLNHTARILVPHDCSENPFKNILPQMAVRDSNLLNLLLAYSASHRARFLNHPEPANRIALWVQDVFPSLRKALNDSTSPVSNANLATAIMLASLQIISPNTFEVPVSWQNHLTVARRMLLARGGAGSVHRKDRVSYFLSRWFAYLDVLGSLSGGDQPLFGGEYWAADEVDEDHAFQIDCLLGFTSRCVSILAKIAGLARDCDTQRIDSTGHLRPNWHPSASAVTTAEKLKAELQDARTHRYPGCPHRQAGDVNENKLDSLEMMATNDAFHWAGQIHLNRRVLGKDSSDPEVQTAVREIVDALSRVRKGGTAEACLIFPMFTAGCDAQETGQRRRILERLQVVEGTGMTQVNKARRLMEKVWETGRPWETLVSGEFFG